MSIKIQLKKNNTTLSRIVIVLFPFFIIFLSEILQISYKEFSSLLKIIALGYMVFYSIFSLKYSNILLFFSLLFIPIFTYGIFNSFNFNAAINEGVRYLFPVVVLFYSYSIRNHFKLLLTVLIAFTLINDAIQLINYINWIRGVDQWFYYYGVNGMRDFHTSSGIIRATGIVVFFGLFGFLNLIGFFLTKHFYIGKHKKLILVIFAISIFLSFSYKTIGTFLLLAFLQYKNKLKFFRVVLVIYIVAQLLIPSILMKMWGSLILRIQQYITVADSARSESYRVMFSEFANFNLFGRGIGAFGGPESVNYNSPFYDEVSFNWYKTTNLNTTDTYYPHLFVELGLVGGVFYLLLILSPIFMKWPKSKLYIVFVIYFSLLFDSLFSFSLNNIAFAMISLVFIYPLYYFNFEIDKNFKIKKNAE
jgi:hypothetical protein